MSFNQLVILLLLIAPTVQEIQKETEQEKTVEKLLGEQVLKVQTGAEAGLQLYGKWVDQALSSLMAAVAQESIKTFPELAISSHKHCSKKANSIRKHAKCVARLLDHHERPDKPKHINYLKDKPNKGAGRAKREVLKRDNYRLQSSRDDNVFNALTHMVTSLVKKKKGKEDRRSWNALYSSLMDQKNLMDKKQLLADSLFHNSEKRKIAMLNPEHQALLKVLREGVNLGLRATGHNGTTEGDILRMASPRFLSIVPEEERDREKSFLSPSLFSLHGKGEGIEKETSLHGLLRKIDPKAPDSLLEMITEITGLSDAVEDAEKKAQDRSVGVIANSKGKMVSVSKENMTRIYGDEGYRTMKVLEKLHSTYDKDQIEGMNSTGYTIMSKGQLELVYGKGSPFEDQEVLMRNLNLTRRRAKSEIAKAIRQLANGKATFNRRMKDLVLSPLLKTAFVLKPSSGLNLILSPAILSPLILSPAIFGAVILSPWLFVPLVLSPRVFSPVVLSPFLFSPLILSPFLGNPLILSPGVANPLILSPAVLNPVILSPFTLSPFVLSPFVLSPVILSPSIVGGLVLSPYALSPIIGSKPIGRGIIFASPGFLS